MVWPPGMVLNAHPDTCDAAAGYVDVEFGLLGVPSVGCAIGGLGKMPGVYFRQQNADSPHMLLEAFHCAVDYALDMPATWQQKRDRVVQLFVSCKCRA